LNQTLHNAHFWSVTTLCTNEVRLGDSLISLKSFAVFVLLNASGAGLALGDVPPNQTVHLTNGATAVSYNH
jgi:hypothetical protein